MSKNSCFLFSAAIKWGAKKQNFGTDVFKNFTEGKKRAYFSTVIIQVSVMPSSFALMVAEPGLTAVTLPD